VTVALSFLFSLPSLVVAMDYESQNFNKSLGMHRNEMKEITESSLAAKSSDLRRVPKAWELSALRVYTTSNYTVYITDPEAGNRP
jgi:hypothetical protein